MQETQDVARPATFLLSDEVMDYARISRRTLDRWVSEGVLPVKQSKPRGVRRYLKSDVDRVIDGEVA